MMLYNNFTSIPRASLTWFLITGTRNGYKTHCKTAETIPRPALLAAMPASNQGQMDPRRPQKKKSLNLK